MANIGDKLVSPEEGTKRISCTNMNISYTSTFSFSDNTKYTDTKNEQITFYFYGTKLIILDNKTTNRSNNIQVIIDNETETYSGRGTNTNNRYTCVYIKEGLEKTIHKVTIINNSTDSTQRMGLQAIDIDEDGYMIYCDDNSKLYYDMTPIMTSNTTPSPYVAESNSEYDSAHRAWYLFDGNLDPNAAWASSVSAISNIYVTLSLNKKMNTIFIRGCSNRLQNPKDISIMGSNDNSTFDNILDYEISIENSGTLLINTKTTKYKYYKLLCKNNNGATNIALVELRYLLAVDTPFYLIQDNTNNKVYNYDEDNNQLIEVTDISILKENALNNTCIYDLNKILPLIDLKQENIKVISNQNVKSIVKSINSTKQLIIANNDFSTRIADNIDYFESKYSLSDENCAIKTVVSIDSGITWYSIIDGNWTLLDNKVPLNNYEELSDDEKQQWDTFLDEVLEKGINISNIETLDFNILDSEKIRFAYAIQIEDGNSEAILKNLKWQFDSIGTYEQLSPKDEVNIAMSNNEIKIQPLKDVELMKINVGITSQVPQDFDTSGLLDKETFKGKEINSVKKADVAKKLENLSDDNLNKLLQILSFINGSNPQQYLGTNIDNELGMHYLPTNSGTTNGNSIEQRVVLNAKAGDIIPVETVADMQDQKAFIQVFKFEEGDQDVISTLKEFNNANEDNFIYDNDNVSFDDTCHIKNKYVLQNTLNDSTGLYETKFNKTEFLDLFSLTSEVNE